LSSKQCVFCGNNNPVVLQEHHLIPRALPWMIETDKNHPETLLLCANCHVALHYVLRPLLKIIKINLVKDENPNEFSPKQKRASVIKVHLSNMNRLGFTPCEDNDIVLHLSSVYEYKREEILDGIAFLMRAGEIYSPKPRYYDVVKTPFKSLPLNIR
jgi:hypothetical protein